MSCKLGLHLHRTQIKFEHYKEFGTERDPLTSSGTLLTDQTHAFLTNSYQQIKKPFMHDKIHSIVQNSNAGIEPSYHSCRDKTIYQGTRRNINQQTAYAERTRPPERTPQSTKISTEISIIKQYSISHECHRKYHSSRQRYDCPLLPISHPNHYELLVNPS